MLERSGLGDAHAFCAGAVMKQYPEKVVNILHLNELTGISRQELNSFRSMTQDA